MVKCTCPLQAYHAVVYVLLLRYRSVGTPFSRQLPSARLSARRRWFLHAQLRNLAGLHCSLPRGRKRGLHPSRVPPGSTGHFLVFHRERHLYSLLVSIPCRCNFACSSPFLSWFFFGGLSIHLSTALLAHMFSYNITWGATKKVRLSLLFRFKIGTHAPRMYRRLKGQISGLKSQRSRNAIGSC